jgi:hypothetical protein
MMSTITLKHLTRTGFYNQITCTLLIDILLNPTSDTQQIYDLFLGQLVFTIVLFNQLDLGCWSHHLDLLIGTCLCLCGICLFITHNGDDRLIKLELVFQLVQSFRIVLHGTIKLSVSKVVKFSCCQLHLAPLTMCKM